MILDQQVTVGGNDISDHVVSIERRHCICDVMATGVVTLAPSFSSSIDPYDTIVIHEQGVKVFTGYVAAFKKETPSWTKVIDFADPALKLQDYWLVTPYTANGETVQYWIQFFCDLAGVSCTFDTGLPALVPPPDGDYSWQYSSAIEIIRGLLVYAGYWMYSDANGLIHFSQGHYVPITITVADRQNILDSSREQSTTPARNRAVVFGRAVIGEDTREVSALSGRTKTAVVATPYVVTVPQANALATKLINAFSKIKDEKSFRILGDPNVTIAQFANIDDSFLNINSAHQITEVKAYMNNDGYTMDIIFDQYCPKIWGTYDWENIAQRVYASTWGDGVYRTESLGEYWYQLAEGLDGDAMYVTAVNATDSKAWAATKSGLYYLVGSGWEDRTPAVYPSGEPVLYWLDVEIDPSNEEITYALGRSTYNTICLYKTEDDGDTWDYTVIQ